MWQTLHNKMEEQHRVHHLMPRRQTYRAIGVLIDHISFCQLKCSMLPKPHTNPTSVLYLALYKLVPWNYQGIYPISWVICGFWISMHTDLKKLQEQTRRNVSSWQLLRQTKHNVLRGRLRTWGINGWWGNDVCECHHLAITEIEPPSAIVLEVVFN